MASAILRTVASKIRKSAYIMPIFLMVCVGLVISIILSFNDYYTSYMGVRSLPLRGAELTSGFAYYMAWLSDIAMAGTPDVTITIGGYLLLSVEYKRGQRWVFLLIGVIVAIALMGDIQTGYVYYLPDLQFMQDTSPFWAYFRAGFIDTVGSNMLFIVCSGLFVMLMGDFVREFKAFRRTLQGINGDRKVADTSQRGSNSSEFRRQGEGRKKGGGGKRVRQSPPHNQHQRPRGGITGHEQAELQRMLVAEGAMSMDEAGPKMSHLRSLDR